MEIDATHQRAFKLVQRRREESVEQLRKMLFEALGRKYEPAKPSKKADKKLSDKDHKADGKKSSKATAVAVIVDDDKGYRHTETARGKEERTDKREEVVVVDDEGGRDDVDMSMDADNFALDLDIACTICKQFDVSSSNKLLECAECQCLYHQQCHTPVVSEAVADDPRFLWYCTKCARNKKRLEKLSAQPGPGKSSTSQHQKLKEGKPSSSTISLDDQQPQPASFFSKRETAKVGAGDSSATNEPYSGLAGLAANLAGKTDKNKDKKLKNVGGKEKLKKKKDKEKRRHETDQDPDQPKEKKTKTMETESEAKASVVKGIVHGPSFEDALGLSMKDYDPMKGKRAKEAKGVKDGGIGEKGEGTKKKGKTERANAIDLEDFKESSKADGKKFSKKDKKKVNDDFDNDEDYDVKPSHKSSRKDGSKAGKFKSKR